MEKTLQDYTNEYNAAKSQGNVEGMIAANQGAIQFRLDSGEITPDQVQDYTASQDIANVQAQVDAIKAKQSPSVSSVSGVSSAAGSVPTYEGSTLPTPTNYSDYINDLYSVRDEAALADLEAAYQQNVAELNASQAEIAPAYQSARNQTAASSEQSKRNFAEYANAYGLNSGTSGQAELARGVTLQNNLNALDQAEADAFAELDLQRSQVAGEYNAAVASAKATGNYELAAALYQEAVRVDNALLSDAATQANLDYNTWSTNYGVWQDMQNRTDTLAAQQKSDDRIAQDTMASYGQLWLQYGLMPSDAMLNAMGISREKAQSLIDKINGG